MEKIKNKNILNLVLILFILIAIPNKTYSATSVNENIETKVNSIQIKEKQVNKIKFLKMGVKVFEDAKQKHYREKLIKGTRVKLISKKETTKKTISKDKKEIIKKDIFYKIQYKILTVPKVAWVSGKNIFVSDLNEILPERVKGLEFKEKIKKEYKNNKKIKVKGLYVSANTVALTRRLDELIKLSKEAGINAFVIDVKDDFGKITFPVSEKIKKFNVNSNKNPVIKNIEPIMKKLKENNIYTIARIVSFKDPIYAKANPDKAIRYKENGKPFTNSDGIPWVSAHDRNLWKYNIAVAKEAAEAGFNEIQFDYVRFPASNGGKLDKILDYGNKKNETKASTIQKYLAYARKELSPLGVYISADIYGQVGSSYDDMALGQFWEAVSNEVDYVSPMIYPSHYGRGVYGLSVPDANPYKTVYRSVKDSLNRNNNIDSPAEIRPWIQAFTASWVKGHIKYGKKEVKEQIKAMKDLKVEEFILWDPTNRYERYL